MSEPGLIPTRKVRIGLYDIITDIPFSIQTNGKSEAEYTPFSAIWTLLVKAMFSFRFSFNPNNSGCSFAVAGSQPCLDAQ